MHAVRWPDTARLQVRVKCNADDTIGDLKKLIAAQTGTRAEKIRLQKWYNIYKDHITLEVCSPCASFAHENIRKKDTHAHTIYPKPHAHAVPTCRPRRHSTDVAIVVTCMHAQWVHKQVCRRAIWPSVCVLFVCLRGCICMWQDYEIKDGMGLELYYN